MYSAVLLVLLFSVSAAIANEKVLICYYGTWATYRWGTGKFDVETIDPNLCTHLVYTFVGINPDGSMISLDPYLDLADNWGRGNFNKFTALKSKNPKLKTILAVGGWNEGSAKYSTMAANPVYRQNFIQSTLKMIQDHNFDGLDVDWEYPNRRDSVYGGADVNHFTQLLKELRQEFDQRGLLLTAAVSSIEASASLSYNVAAISNYLDYISVMAYDMYGAWDPVTGHNAPLHSGEGDEAADPTTLFTVDMALKYWLGAGCPPEKLIVGVPFYGRTFTLANPAVTSVRAPASGEGIAGPYTATNGFIGYNEICLKLQTEAWTVKTDEKAKVPYAYQNQNWVSYDDPTSIKAKVDYAMSLNLGGIMVWSIETDDFNGLCGKGDFPLLRTINKALDRDVSETSTEAVVSTSTAAPGTESSSSSSSSTTSAPSPSTSTASPASSTSTDIPSSTTSAPSPSTSTASPSSSTSTDSPSSTTSAPSPSTSTASPSSSTSTDSSSSTTSAPSPSTSTASPSSTTSTSASSTAAPGTICSQAGFAADPTDCSSYYMCVLQPDYSLLAVKFPCPQTLKWDQSNLYCNYPEYVNCA